LELIVDVSTKFYLIYRLKIKFSVSTTSLTALVDVGRSKFRGGDVEDRWNGREEKQIKLLDRHDSEREQQPVSNYDDDVADISDGCDQQTFGGLVQFHGEMAGVGSTRDDDAQIRESEINETPKQRMNQSKKRERIESVVDGQ
jgi:hypothetical protein